MNAPQKESSKAGEEGGCGDVLRAHTYCFEVILDVFYGFGVDDAIMHLPVIIGREARRGNERGTLDPSRDYPNIFVIMPNGERG